MTSKLTPEGNVKEPERQDMSEFSDRHCGLANTTEGIEELW